MSYFTYGDSVQVKTEAPRSMRPGALAAICGISEVENEVQAKEYGVPVGSTVYLVEFGDGASVEIPEILIEVVRTT
jgi:hypothetical protein